MAGSIVLTYNYSAQPQIVTVPAGTVGPTITVAGAAGGSGGSDAGASAGGYGSGRRATFAIPTRTSEYQLTFYVGNVADNGFGCVASSGSGGGGDCGGNLDGDGGRGGNAGGSGCSGGGGGGGGATAVYDSFTGTYTVVAGGGGGGGGASLNASGGGGGVASAFSVNASITPLDGGQGADKGGDGAGGGGGGGGCVVNAGGGGAGQDNSSGGGGGAGGQSRYNTYSLVAGTDTSSYSGFVQLTFTSPAVLTYFRANDQSPSTTIDSGQSVVLSWSTNFGTINTATSASINQGVGSVSTGINSITVGPLTTTTVFTMTVSDGSTTAQKSVTVNVAAPDNIPDLFTFSSVTDAAISTSYTSNTVTISGLGTGISVNVSATNGAETSVNGGAFSTATKTITNGQTLAVRMTSSASYNTLKSTTVSVGSTDAIWNITTASAPAQIPNTFSFNNVIDAPLQAYTNSNIVTISGITQSVTVSAPTNNFESSVNGGAFSTAAKTITNGQTLQLRVLTSNVLGETKFTNITVGGGSPVSWNVTNVLVADSNPDYFNIDDVSNATASTLTSSSPITITGINVPTTVSTTNGAQISVNSGAYVNSPTTINNNQTLAVRLTSSATPGGIVTTDVTVGSLTDTFNITTTTAGDTNPDPFSFIARVGQPPSTLVESNAVVITGITSPSPVLITGGAQLSINGGSWVTSGTINNGDTLKIRITSSATLGGSVSTTVTIG